MDYGTINPKDEIFLTRWGTTPYQILRAQQIIERLLPFLEQDVAARLAQAHGLLFSWTTALWGTPILLAETEDPSQNALGDNPTGARDAARERAGHPDAVLPAAHAEGKPSGQPRQPQEFLTDLLWKEVHRIDVVECMRPSSAHQRKRTMQMWTEPLT